MEPNETEPEADPYIEGYRAGYLAGYGEGVSDGRFQGYADARHRAYRAVIGDSDAKDKLVEYLGEA